MNRDIDSTSPARVKRAETAFGEGGEGIPLFGLPTPSAAPDLAGHLAKLCTLPTDKPASAFARFAPERAKAIALAAAWGLADAAAIRARIWISAGCYGRWPRAIAGEAEAVFAMMAEAFRAGGVDKSLDEIRATYAGDVEHLLAV